MKSSATSSLQSRWRARLETGPEARCLTFYGRRGQGAWLSRADVHRRAAGVAARLAEAGLAAGDVCVLALPSGERVALALLGTLLLGGVPLLVAPPSIQGANLDLPRILARTLRRTRARLAVCADAMEGEGRELARRSPSTIVLSEADLAGAGEVDDIPAILPRSEAVAAMQLTSGTTAFPRVCVWEQRAVLAALDGMMTAMRVREGDVCFNWTPLYHDMGLVNNFFLAFSAGMPLAMLSPQEFIGQPALWLKGLAATGATMTWSPNFGFAIAARRATDAELEGVRLDRVRAFWNAAERIHLATMVVFHRRFATYGVRLEALKTNYGCAENIGGATFSDPDGEAVAERVDRELLQRGVARPVTHGPEAMAETVVSAGRPYPGVEIRVVSPAGRTLPEGRVGEIALRTPSRLLRYERDARATRRAIRGEWLYTGDLGYLRGGKLFWTGRLRERIAVQGKKLDPSAFEAPLAEVEGLREGCFVAFGVDEAVRGTQKVVIVAEVREPLGRGLDEITADVRRRIFYRMGVGVGEVLLVPRGTLAKTSSGKRRHRHARVLYLEGRMPVLAPRPGAGPAATAPAMSQAP